MKKIKITFLTLQVLTHRSLEKSIVHLTGSNSNTLVSAVLYSPTGGELTFVIKIWHIQAGVTKCSLFLETPAKVAADDQGLAWDQVMGLLRTELI